MGVRVRERRRLLTVFGSEGGGVLRPKRPLRDGTNLYQKPMPKQDKGGGITPTAEGVRLWT